MSVFSQAWRDCLREHYQQVIRENPNPTGDQTTRIIEPLRDVLHQVGFREDELKELAVLATIRADEVPDDFQPDLNILEPAADLFQPHPLECQCAACMELNLTPHDADGQPLPPDADGQPLPPDEPKNDTPRQLSLF